MREVGGSAGRRFMIYGIGLIRQSEVIIHKSEIQQFADCLLLIAEHASAFFLADGLREVVGVDFH